MYTQLVTIVIKHTHLDYRLAGKGSKLLRKAKQSKSSSFIDST
jgi:hypothetical protein